MEISPLTSAGQPASAKSAAGLADNFDNFLQLLTTQLQNQDPLEPLQSTDFTAQLVQFASVEQQIGANTNLERLISLQQSNQSVGAVSFIGKSVEAVGNNVALSNGSGRFAYHLAEGAETVTVKLTNAAGKVVRTIEGDISPGRHEVVWDGTDDLGLPLADGTYSVQVTARDAEDNPTVVETSVFGRVTGVSAQDGSLMLHLGSVAVPLNDILSVSESDGSDSTSTETS